MTTNFAEPLELYPDERNRLVLILASINRKYIGKPNTRENLLAYGNEVEGRCLDELNLVVFCDIANMEMGEDGHMYSSPVAIPLRRTTPEVFDFEKARKQVQAGFADGVPGVLTEDGRLVDPNKQVPVSGVELG